MRGAVEFLLRARQEGKAFEMAERHDEMEGRREGGDKYTAIIFAGVFKTLHLY